MKPEANLMDKIVSLAKRRGFIFPGSEIYGGLANIWDFGPLGVELKNNVKRLWWKHFVSDRNDVYGLDSSILMHGRVWEASGHVENFSDPMVDCLFCKARFRADHLVEERLNRKTAGLSEEKLSAIIKKEKIPCPACAENNFTPARKFNLMFKTSSSIIEGEENGNDIYLRPETAQGIFVNFKNVLDSLHPKLPFGIAQIGKAFRNEITPGNFIYRTREFEQMELEYFYSPKEREGLKHYKELSEYCLKFFLSMGVKKENLRFREHAKDELSHYSSRTQDIEYRFPFGWGELNGIAMRGDYDLGRHGRFSGVDLRYTDQATGEKFYPYVIEPSFGVERTVLAILADAYHEEKAPTAEQGETEDRVVLRFDPAISPVKAAVLPLLRKEDMVKKAVDIYEGLKRSFKCVYDETASIGKRYRRQDEIGTPFCITIDHDTLEGPQKDTVTVRNRDSMRQERVSTADLVDAFKTKL